MKLHHTNTTFKDYNPRNSDQFVFRAVDKSDVMQIIFNMKSSSSTGHEMFSNKLIKLIRDGTIYLDYQTGFRLSSGIFTLLLRLSSFQER